MSDAARPRADDLSVCTLMTGIGALLLPFAYGTSPRDATFDGEPWPLAVPFYLAFLIGLASLRLPGAP